MSKPLLTIIILSYNTKDLLRNCLSSLEKVKKEADFEVIVADNNSNDGSSEMVENKFPWVLKVIRNNQNLGFSAGNNVARPYVRGKYVLFLNSDTIVYKDTLKECLSYMEKHAEIGALTCRVELKDGSLDKDTRRSFITPWIGLTHIYLKLDRLFPTSKVFAKYWYGYIPDTQIHEIDALQGAFFLSRKEILDKVGWFDEDYFLDGEDIDLSWKIKKIGLKNVYYPKVSITHLKGASKGKNQINKSVALKDKLKYRLAGVNSMETFVKKRLWNEYPLPFMYFVLTGIKILKVTRFIKTIITG